MKKALIIVLVIAVAILLIPIRGQFKDGGTVEYRAVLYNVQDMHQIHFNENDDGSSTFGFIVGIVVKILGFEVYNNTKWVPAE